jgi:predicted nucleic acid-binding protein
LRKGNVTTHRPEGVFAVDAGVLIDLVYATQQGIALREAVLSEKVAIITHELALVGLRYILCRRIGKPEAWARVEKLISSGYLLVENVSPLMESAAYLKCERRISLPDCFTLALADRMKISALFAHREAEIEKELLNKPFSVEVSFLDELAD